MGGGQAGYLVLLDSRGSLVAWVASDPDPDPASPMPDTSPPGPAVEALLQGELVGQMLQQRRVMLVQDAEAEVSGQASALLRQVSGRSLLLIPLTTEVELSGVLILAHAEPGAFRAHPETRVMAAAEIVQQAIQNAWRYRQMQKEEAARDRMVNAMVHDIRSPLMATSASLDVIVRAMEEGAFEPAAHQFIQESLASGKRGIQEVVELTNDLLNVKRLQSGRYPLDRQPVMVELLYDEIYQLLYNLAIQRHILLRYQVRPRALRILADERLLRRTLINLVANALRFSPEYRTVKLEASESPRCCTVTMEAYTSPDDWGVLLVVEDMGPGVPPEEREFIFQPFAQARGESHRGTGLGLAFCREVVVAHGGRIWVEDRPGGGSRFCVLLPGQPSARSLSHTSEVSDSRDD
ncbi:MAG: HAMP domain-containing histidine kinase [Chloroflexaceae bacterium]|nr:HAMP domain-containing histidine kinase [Chloroflexaceae bacterium]